MTLSEKISSCRRKQGLSQEALAAQLNVSRQAVSKWETGDTEPESGKLIALAQTFGVTVDWLLKTDDTSLEAAWTQTIQKEATEQAAQPARRAWFHAKLRMGYVLYLCCLILFFVVLMSTEFRVLPAFSMQISFRRILDFFDPVLLSAMLAGCILLLWGSRALRPMTQVFRLALGKGDTASPEETASSCCAVTTALVGWGLGGLVYLAAMTVNSLRSVSLEGRLGSLAVTWLNFLMYAIFALFVLLPIRQALKRKQQ